MNLERIKHFINLKHLTIPLVSCFDQIYFLYNIVKMQWDHNQISLVSFCSFWSCKTDKGKGVPKLLLILAPKWPMGLLSSKVSELTVVFALEPMRGCIVLFICFAFVYFLAVLLSYLFTYHATHQFELCNSAFFSILLSCATIIRVSFRAFSSPLQRPGTH